MYVCTYICVCMYVCVCEYFVSYNALGEHGEEQADALITVEASLVIFYLADGGVVQVRVLQMPIKIQR